MELGQQEREVIATVHKTHEELKKRLAEWEEIRETTAEKPTEGSADKQPFIAENAVLNDKDIKLALGDLSAHLMKLELQVQFIVKLCLTLGLDEDMRRFKGEAEIFGCNSVRKLTSEMLEEFCTKRLPQMIAAFEQVLFPTSERQQLMVNYLNGAVVCMVCKTAKPQLRCMESGHPYCRVCYGKKEE